MWMLLLNFLREVRLRLTSMNQPWFYDKISGEWLKSVEIREDTNSNA